MKFLAITIFVIVLISLTSFFLYSLTIPSPFLSSMPSITHTKNGHAGDPINIVIIGNKNDMIKAFTQAQWFIPDRIDELSTIKIIKTSITNSAYPAAPISNLYLFGRIQDVAFENPTNTVRKRHHIRLWKTGKLVSGQDVWLGSASFDSGIELSGTTHFPTHHIDPDVDAERNILTQSLQTTGLVKSSRLERVTFPFVWGHNGNGDWYFYDGNAQVITLR